jgi:hypothetical protein
MIEPNRRNEPTDAIKNERDPNAEKLESRSASLDRLEEGLREPPRVDGFTYEVKFQNLDTRQAQTIFWEYEFKENATQQNTSRHRFVCGVKIKPDKDKLIRVFSTLGPGTVIDVKNMPKGSGKQFDESVVIDRIDFEDGSVWQRKDWNFEEAKFAVAKRSDRSGICKGF